LKIIMAGTLGGDGGIMMTPVVVSGSVSAILAVIPFVVFRDLLTVLIELGSFGIWGKEFVFFLMTGLGQVKRVGMFALALLGLWGEMVLKEGQF